MDFNLTYMALKYILYNSCEKETLVNNSTTFELQIVVYLEYTTAKQTKGEGAYAYNCYINGKEE